MPHPFKVQSVLGGVSTDARLSIITATDPGGLFVQQPVRYTVLDGEPQPPTPQPPLPAVNDLDLTFMDSGFNDPTNPWIPDDEITVNGWDWTMPPNSVPHPRSGIFQNSNGDTPAYLQGFELNKVNADWVDLEPSEGNFDMTIIEDGLADNNFDGVFHFMPLSCMPESTIEMLMDLKSKELNLPVYHFPIDEEVFRLCCVKG